MNNQKKLGGKKQMIDRGHALGKKSIKKGGIYAFNYVLTLEESGKLNTSRNQWGFGMIDKDGNICPSWNCSAEWHDAYNNTPVSSESMTFYAARPMEKVFINNVRTIEKANEKIWDLLKESADLEEQLDHSRTHVEELRRNFKEYVNSPIIKIADAIKTFFS